jgi:hypothetical protein
VMRIVRLRESHNDSGQLNAASSVDATSAELGMPMR